MKICIQKGVFEQWVWVVDKSPKIKNDNMIIIIFHEDVDASACRAPVDAVGAQY